MIIYKTTNKINGKSYIGQTSKSLDVRRKQHIKDAKRLKDYFHYALIKYGSENFEWEEIAWTNTKEKLNEYEIRMIDFYNSKIPNGYNLTDGGGGNNGWHPSKETIKRMSRANIGEKNPNFGKHPSEETRRKIGRPKEKHPLWKKHHREDTIEKMKQKAMGRKQTEEVKKRKNQRISRIWIVKNPGGEYSIIRNLKFFCKENNLIYSNMATSVYGSKGWHCKKISDK